MIGIIGMGYVGSAIYANIDRQYIDKVYVYDKYKKLKKNSNLKMLKFNCEFIFVCVSTPENEDGSINSSNVLEVLDELKDYSGTIILKSTILESDIPDLNNLVYNPEFLNQRTSNKDFQTQDYIVIGGEIQNTSAVAEMYTLIFNLGNKFELCSIKEASNFKYLRNIKSALELLFWEFAEDITKDSRKISNMLKNIPLSDMSIIGMDGFRGYGGACLPKDVNAFNHKHGHLLTKFMKEYNDTLDV